MSLHCAEIPAHGRTAMGIALALCSTSARFQVRSASRLTLRQRSQGVAPLGGQRQLIGDTDLIQRAVTGIGHGA